jgi:LAO/AO transport system kinase
MEVSLSEQTNNPAASVKVDPRSHGFSDSPPRGPARRFAGLRAIPHGKEREERKNPANAAEVTIDIPLLAQQVSNGQRRALARALTLVESELPEHQAQSLQLFRHLGDAPRAFRLGITGPPGAGKSTVIERLVLGWLEQGGNVAVLTIDPSSRRTGGSLLGDKTRMGRIADHPRVFIRPSPNSQALGGLGRRTPLMCSLLERAGYDRVVVETVGVGQSEIVARYLVDRLLLVALPGAGDEVQGIKRGLMEEVDVVAVNKADLGTAKAAVANLRSAFRVFRREVPVLAISALTGEGVDALAKELEISGAAMDQAGEAYFFEQHTLHALRKRLEADPAWCVLRDRVRRGELDFLTSLPELERLLSQS